MQDPKLNHVWLLSFGDSRLEKPRSRLARQARAFGFAEDHVLILNENDLSPSFREAHREHLVLGSRGYGYWCWKPEVCLRTLEKIPDGDILLYVDIGCHLRRKGRNRFYDYLGIAEERGFCAFQYRSLLSTETPDPLHHYNLMKDFTKGDLLDYFGVRDNPRIVNAGQVMAGILFLRKGEEAMELCRACKKVFDDDFRLMDDSPSRSPNLVASCRHRHDQSALGILWLLKGLPTVSACEIEPSRRWVPAPAPFRHDSRWGAAYFFQMGRFPLHARRDKGQVSLPVKIWRHAWAYYLKPFFAKLRK